MLERGGLCAGHGLAVDERQMDRAVGVGVRNRRVDAGIHNLKRDLLAAFAGKRLAGRFARFDLPSDELPMAAKRLSDWPPPEKILVSSANDAANDFYDFSFHGFSLISCIIPYWGSYLPKDFPQFSAMLATQKVSGREVELEQTPFPCHSLQPNNA